MSAALFLIAIAGLGDVRDHVAGAEKPK